MRSLALGNEAIHETKIGKVGFPVNSMLLQFCCSLPIYVLSLSSILLEVVEITANLWEELGHEEF